MAEKQVLVVNKAGRHSYVAESKLKEAKHRDPDLKEVAEKDAASAHIKAHGEAVLLRHSDGSYTLHEAHEAAEAVKKHFSAVIINKGDAEYSHGLAKLKK